MQFYYICEYNCAALITKTIILLWCTLVRFKEKYDELRNWMQSSGSESLNDL